MQAPQPTVPDRAVSGPNRPGELEAIYSQRFNDHIAYRQQIWRVLVSKYFARFIDPDAAVLDVGCGYGEFINHVVCREKFGIDLNSRARERLNPDVTFFEQDCSARWPLPDRSLDLVFTSNFFEHLHSKQALGDTVAQAYRCLKPGGRMIAMGPNIRFIGGAYWDFWDHHLALTDISMAELLRVQGFAVERAFDRFLPYTMVNHRSVPEFLVSAYLRLPLAWKLFGKQFLVFAARPTRD